MIGFEKFGDTWRVVLEDPDDIPLMMELEEFLASKVKPVLKKKSFPPRPAIPDPECTCGHTESSHESDFASLDNSNKCYTCLCPKWEKFK
ncbi:hypothetical protein LCGC14_0677170 [marine sediment metagenome]|uniref:Uncharacterized protein n=1 Tax=marine sediment metagenome TaxID=412755 RepID=A0A0F9TX93_9ZZZZ